MGFNKAIIGTKGIVIIKSAIVKQNLQADLQACTYRNQILPVSSIFGERLVDTPHKKLWDD